LQRDAAKRNEKQLRGQNMGKNGQSLAHAHNTLSAKSQLIFLAYRPRFGL
jgi:hypothetical protein